MCQFRLNYFNNSLIAQKYIFVNLLNFEILLVPRCGCLFSLFQGQAEMVDVSV